MIKVLSNPKTDLARAFMAKHGAKYNVVCTGINVIQVQSMRTGQIWICRITQDGRIHMNGQPWRW